MSGLADTIGVWDGRDPLTAWPEKDWKVMLGDPSWMPIWDRPPMTSSSLLARCGVAPHDNAGTFGAASTPFLIDGQEYDRRERRWARIVDTLREQESEPEKKRPPRKTVLRPQPRVTTLKVEQHPPCANSGRVRHQSRLWALKARLVLAAKPDTPHPERLEAYKCIWCGTWHVGHRA